MSVVTQVHCICSTEARAMQVQQAHLADINSWQTCIYLSVRAVRTVIRQGSVRDQNQKVGMHRERVDVWTWAEC